MLNNGLFNFNTPLLPNPMGTPVAGIPAQTATLGLNQIEGFTPVAEFTDESNTPWRLVKEASNSTVDVPDPKSLQITDYWNHEYPGLKSKLYCYVVEGIKQPRVETEQATRVLYQWFSPVFIPTFTPSMITEKEWLKANVYAAPVISARLSKLNALCKVKETTAKTQAPADENKLLHVEGISNGTTAERAEAQS